MTSQTFIHDLTGVDPYRTTSPRIAIARKTGDRLWTHHRTCCDDLLNWSQVDLVNMGGKKIVSVVILVDISGSRKGSELAMADAINRICSKVAAGPFAASTFITVIFFNDGLRVAVKFISLLEMPIISARGNVQNGDIEYVADGNTNLSGAIVAGCWQQMALGDYAINTLGYGFRKIIVGITDGGHNEGIFGIDETSAMLEGCFAQEGRMFFGLVSIGDLGIARYAKSLGLDPASTVWTIEKTEEGMDEMVRRVSSTIVARSAYVVAEAAGEQGLFSETLDLDEAVMQPPTWEEVPDEQQP